MDRFPTNPRDLREVGVALRAIQTALDKLLRPSGDVLVDTQAAASPSDEDRGYVLRANDGQYCRLTAINVSPGVYSAYMTPIGTTRP